MGSIMAGRLVAAGHNVTVFNRSAVRSHAFARDTGADYRTTAAAIAEGADLVLGMLFDEQAVRDVYGGPHGIVSSLQPGQVVAEMGTVGLPAITWLAGEAARTGADVLDAPVSGSMATARQGQLLIMVGGEAAAVERARPALEAMGKAVMHLGPVGSGTRMKLALNSAVYALNQALAESLLLAERSGIDRSTAYDVFANSVIAGPAVHYRRPVFEQPGGPVQSLSIEGAEKDLRLALELADEVGLTMGQARYNASVLAGAQAGGFGGRDVGEVAEYLRTTLGTDETAKAV
jgi:3-hydroxyisobutyrate dehydrogenase-like beta-hydroxyacid dehydrogenase